MVAAQPREFAWEEGEMAKAAGGLWTKARRWFTPAAVLGLTLAITALACSSESDTGSNTSKADAGADSGICAVNGAACDDGNACTTGDQCAGGQCKGSAKLCDDGLACTTDSCDPAKGCAISVGAGLCAVDGTCPAAGAIKPGNPCLVCDPAKDGVGWSNAATACDDNSVCTLGDTCANGACGGTALNCDDKNPCTVDTCDTKLGCQHAAASGPCDDGNPCTSGDYCAANLCHGATATDCDDKDICTLNKCDAALGCQYPPDPKTCDDGKPCTVDVCQKGGNCSHVNKKPGDDCSTGNPCVVGQACSIDLTCTGGAPLPCDDSNPCTADSCKAGIGCVHALSSAPCDDGQSCTSDDLCTGGVCIGSKTWACPKCSNTFASSAAKLTLFQIGASGKPGEGFDVDGNPKTCAPADSCEAGIDNSAAVLGPFINKALIAGVQDGSMTFVVELLGYQKEGKAFTLNMYAAEQTEASTLAGCKPLADVCEWQVLQAAMTAQCQPKFSFKNAMIQGGKLTAGDKDTLFAMQSELIGAKNASLYVKGARIEGNVTFASDGVQIQSMQGILGGALPMESLMDVINASSDGSFAATGLSKEAIISLVKQLLQLDLDIDGDGVAESASIGIRFTGVGAKLVGMNN